jgi:hypothetical protein
VGQGRRPYPYHPIHPCNFRWYLMAFKWRCRAWLDGSRCSQDPSVTENLPGAKQSSRTVAGKLCEWKKECMHACMNEWMNAWMNEWVNEWMNERTKENERRIERRNEQRNERRN